MQWRVCKTQRWAQFIITLTFITNHKSTEENKHVQKSQAKPNPTTNTLQIRRGSNLFFTNWSFYQVFKHITKEKILLTPRLRDYLDGNPNFESQAVLPKKAQSASHLNFFFSPLLMLRHKKGFFSRKSEIIDNKQLQTWIVFMDFYFIVFLHKKTSVSSGVGRP